MGTLSAEQQRTLDELTALRDAPGDDDVEVYVRDERGRETRLTGAQAERWLAGLFGDDSGKPPVKKAAKKAAKKATAPAAGADDQDDDDGDQDDDDTGDGGDPPPERSNWYFGKG